MKEPIKNVLQAGTQSVLEAVDERDVWKVSVWKVSVSERGSAIHVIGVRVRPGNVLVTL